MEEDVLKTSVLAKKNASEVTSAIASSESELGELVLSYQSGWGCMRVIEDSIDGEFLSKSLCELPLREQSLFAGGGGEGGVVVNGW